IVTFKVGKVEETYTIFVANKVTKQTLESSYTSPTFSGLYFVLTDLHGIGKLTVKGPQADAKIAFTVTFARFLVTALKLPQASYTGELSKDMKEEEITLRAKTVPEKDWVDLRTTLPYMWRLPVGSTYFLNGVFKMWSKDIDAKSKIDDYIVGPFVANRTLSAAYPIHSNVNQYTYKLAPKLAKLLDFPEVFDSEVQSIKVYVKDG